MIDHQPGCPYPGYTYPQFKMFCSRAQSVNNIQVADQASLMRGAIVAAHDKKGADQFKKILDERMNS